jgi:hypothetical protein
MGRRLDAERMALRYLDVIEMMGGAVEPDVGRVADAFEELLRAEVIFPGPSLYANPPDGPV